jgi:transposase
VTKPPRLSMSREEIRAVYAEGEAAVIALVERLIERINQLETRVEALENQVSKNSRNSSKPPSGDGFGKRTKSLRQPSERSSGGQAGHRGQTLEWSAEPDQVAIHPVERCGGCGLDLRTVAVEDWAMRQVQDIAPVPIQVTEHQSEVKSCPGCGRVNRGKFPAGVGESVQYGPQLQGLMVYLMVLQLLPSQRVCELLSEVFGVSVSEGTLYNVRARCFEALGPSEIALKAALKAAPLLHLDETGLRVKQQLQWLHVASSAQLTLYFVHAKRGQLALDEFAILPGFKGNGVHDGWHSYMQYDFVHSLCNAHHLRELTFIVERYQQDWANQMITLLVTMKRQVDEAKAQDQTALSRAQIADLERQYTTLLDQGFAANPPEPIPEDQPKSRGRPKQSPAKNLLDRLKSQQEAVLRFLHDFAVPFDNNQAERDLRMMKLKQKISGCFRSQDGAQQFCRIRSYVSCLRKQGRNVLDALVQLFIGVPFSPLPTPE